VFPALSTFRRPTGPIGEVGMTEHLPKVSEGLEIHEIDEGLIVYQDSTDRVHHLNHTAAVILELCDGTRSIVEIAQSVGKVFALVESPETETEACIDGLVREGLVS
jgi:Coenzyme PQQ synthesis protein D (PqqD)